MGLLHLDTYSDLATAIAQTWNGPSATVWEDVLASRKVDIRIAEVTYRQLRDSIDSRTLVPAHFVSKYLELYAIAQSERQPDSGPCQHCHGAPGWREITDAFDARFHGPSCTWLADRTAGRSAPDECMCWPVDEPCTCPLGQRARVQHAGIERRRAARHAATGTAPTPTTEPAYEDVPLPPEPFDEFEFT